MSDPAKFNHVVSFLWAMADLLNGAFQKSEFQKIIRTVNDCCCGTGGTFSNDQFADKRRSVSQLELALAA